MYSMEKETFPWGNKEMYIYIEEMATFPQAWWYPTIQNNSFFGINLHLFFLFKQIFLSFFFFVSSIAFIFLIILIGG